MLSAHASTFNAWVRLAAGTSIGWGAGSHITPFTLQIGMPFGNPNPLLLLQPFIERGAQEGARPNKVTARFESCTRSISMVNMDRLKHLKSRKDARLVFGKNQNVAVHCLTKRCNFDCRIENVSSSGIFISTDQQLVKGEEIAVSFTFPNSGNSVKATGKVARVTDSGIGIEILA